MPQKPLRRTKSRGKTGTSKKCVVKRKYEYCCDIMDCKVIAVFAIHTRDHSFNTYTKFSEKLTFLTPWYAHVGVCIRG